jgi:nucleotide-binding universal stress UspA family protein
MFDSEKVARHTTTLLRSLLVPLDLSPVSDRVVGRLALLPLADEAQVTLLHVLPTSLALSAQRRAEVDARRALDAEARSLVSKLPRSVTLETAVSVGSPAAEIARRAEASKVDLVVMGRVGGRALRDLFLGSTAERVIRRGRLPVLVVRLAPRTPYRQPGIAIDLDQAARGMLDLLLRVVPSARPTVTIIHAYDVPYEALFYPSLSEEDAEQYRERHRQCALREVRRLLAAALAHLKVPPSEGPEWRTHVRHGRPKTVIEKAMKEADTDLLVLGTHGYSGIAHAFLGSVAGDVLRGVGCDVLVVPPPRRGTARSSRAERQLSQRSRGRGMRPDRLI